MPTTAPRASLMDDLDFVGELEKFDAEPPAHASTASQGSSSDALLDALDDVWEPRATFYKPAGEAADKGAHAAGAHASRQAPAPRQHVRARQPEREPEPQPEIDYAQALVVEERHVVRNVAGFLLMMALGGAAAVLVFHERVVQLLR